MSGLIHLYCGDGKGKTTAAVGLAIRAAGAGMKVVMVQFLKSQPTSELHIIESIPNIQVLRKKSIEKFSFSMTPQEKQLCAQQHNQCFQEALKLVAQQRCALLILDELMAALNCQMIDEIMVKDFIEHKPEHLELVITGRNPPRYLMEAADYISEIKKIKHPYDKGIPARVGIEK